MVFIHRRPAWAIAEALATPEQAFLNRRALLRAMGLGLAATGLAGTIGEAGAANAALFAVALLAASDPRLAAALDEFRAAQTVAASGMKLPG